MVFHPPYITVIATYNMGTKFIGNFSHYCESGSPFARHRHEAPVQYDFGSTL